MKIKNYEIKKALSYPLIQTDTKISFLEKV